MTTRAGSRFHPLDKSSEAMFWRSHDRMMDRIHTFVEIQQGPNPLTDEEIAALARKHPERYGMFLKKKPA